MSAAAEQAPPATARLPAGKAPSVGIVHDYLNQYGGAERVVLEMARIWPEAPMYTSLYRRDSTFPEFADKDIRVSLLDRLPVDVGFRAIAPLYPLAFRSFGRLDHDVILTSSSGWAHGVRTTERSLHIVYCHNPARWLYRPDEHLGRTAGAGLLRTVAGPLRRWDRAAAARADLYIANCENVRRRIGIVYGREAPIVHPPVDVERFTPMPRGERLLVVSRLLPYKRVDLIIEAATRAGIGLDVVGTGPLEKVLRAAAGPTVTFHGRVDDDTLVELMQGCRALCVAAHEDFGIAPHEANAAGKPVIAFAAGGVLETLQEGRTCAFFDDLTVEKVLNALDRADRIETSPQELANAAQSFSVSKFRSRMVRLVDRALAGEID